MKIEEQFEDKKVITELDDENQRIISKKTVYKNGDIEILHFYENRSLKKKELIVVGDYTATFEYDKLHRLVLIEREDGFREETQYHGDTNNRKRVETWYPKGQHEVEHYGVWN